MSAEIQPYDPDSLVAHAAAIAALPRYERAGYLLDVLLCVVTMDGDGVETMSHMSARMALQHKWWACRLCGLLSVLVERQHCPKTLQQGDTSKTVMWRAGTLIILSLIAAGGAADLASRLLWGLILVGVHHVW